MSAFRPDGWTTPELAQAVERGQLELHYQPVVDLRSGGIVGAEALLRWRHPTLGLLPPGQFLPVVESSGLMPEIGAWVLGEACRQMRDWRMLAWRPFRLAVNVSASQVGPDFDGWVKGVLADAELPAEYLEIELTESVAFGDPAIFPALDALRQIGVRFAADDFGTGYSCLQHLKCCPISTLKIDQSFVAGLANDRRDHRRFYEICALSELKNALRSGDIWVKGSRQFRDFDDYLLPAEKFAALKREQALPLAINPNSDQYLEERLQLLDEQLATVARLAKDNELPDAILTESGLKITPLDAAVPDRAQALIDQTSQLLPRIKITELLMDVDDWTGFSRHFTHLKDGAEAKDRTLLLSAILGDAINLGLTKMAESSPGLTYAKLSWLQAWHIRDETYSAALAELVNHQYQHAFAAHWGDGTTSSSDGQRFRAGGRGESTGHVNPKYGSEPGRLFYTHISDQYAPFSTRVVNVGVRDSTYVLDGLLYHESDLRIEEHYTDTAGFTDHVFALMHLLGFRFAPRIRDLGETKLYVPQGVQTYPTLRPLIGGTLNIKHVRAHWDDILRLASSIKQGTVTASLMLRKLGSYPRQNGLAVALRELGRIERTLFILDWLQSVELRRRVHAGLNKGEARNSLARAVFFNRLGEIRDRSFEQQRYRASGLNLVTAAIVLWNTVYLERATQGLVEAGKPVDGELLQFLSPLGWEHINLTGDYVWRQSRRLEDGKFRPLRMPGKP